MHVKYITIFKTVVKINRKIDATPIDTEKKRLRLSSINI